jgi:hypothetical protein
MDLGSDYHTYTVLTRTIIRDLGSDYHTVLWVAFFPETFISFGFPIFDYVRMPDESYSRNVSCGLKKHSP